MSERTGQTELEVVASKVIASLAETRQIPLFSSSGLTLEDAYCVTPLLRAAFEARGEKIIGRKIGFTNRDMWKVYGVEAPIWGYCTDRTTFELEKSPVQHVKDFVEPRIEPEIVFGLKAAPLPSMDQSALLDCIDWISLGYEVVQSIYQDWNFTAPDTIAANALHGSLLISKRYPIAPRKAAWQKELATFRVDLICNGQLSQSGGGALVLGSPLIALQHLVKLLADDPNNPQLNAGEIVSTGTLTLAMPVTAGQSWTTAVEGIALEDVTLGFEA